MAGVGDVDGDGLDDVAVAAVVADTFGRTNNGRVYVVPGKPSTTTVDLTQPGSSIMSLDGSASEERLGSVAAAGDVDGDGVGDLVVGSYAATPHGATAPVAGAAWAVSGAVRGELDLATLDDEGFKVVGPTRARDRLGISVDGAGDVNDDGLDDLLLGGDGVTNAATGPRSGSAWVVFGSASHETVDAGALEVSGRGYWITGAVQGDATGYSVAGIGDVNGDGRPDALIGAYGYDPVNPASPAATMSGAGAAYVVYGKADTAPLALAALAPEQGYRIDGLAAGDRFGRQVGAVGDVDANGAADFAIGSDFAAREGRVQGGEVRLALLPAAAGSPPADPGLPILRSPEIVTATTGGQIRLELLCPADTSGCTGSVKLHAAGGAVPFSLAPGQGADVLVTPNGGNLGKLQKAGRLDDEVLLAAQGRGQWLRHQSRIVVLSLPTVPAPLAAAIPAAHAYGLWEPTALRHLPEDAARPLRGRRARRQAIPDLASADDHEPRHGAAVHLRARARCGPARVGRLRVGGGAALELEQETPHRNPVRRRR